MLFGPANDTVTGVPPVWHVVHVRAGSTPEYPATCVPSWWANAGGATRRAMGSGAKESRRRAKPMVAANARCDPWPPRAADPRRGRRISAHHANESSKTEVGDPRRADRGV